MEQAKEAVNPLVSSTPQLFSSAKGASAAALFSAAQSGSAALDASRAYAAENRALAAAIGATLLCIAISPALSHIWAVYELPTRVALTATWI